MLKFSPTCTKSWHFEESDWNGAQDKLCVILRSGIYVPERGFVPAASCTWEDGGVMQWLTEVVPLGATYERYGAPLRAVCLDLLRVHLNLDTFPPEAFVHALQRIAEHVDRAALDPANMCSMAPLSASALLDSLSDLLVEAYARLARACGRVLTSHFEVRRAFSQERLVFIARRGHTPKRLYSREAWWDLDASLASTKADQLSLVHCFGEHALATQFFIRVLGVTCRCGRAELVQRIHMGSADAGILPLSYWTSGVSLDDIEDLETIQASAEFRPRGWRPQGPDAEDELIGGPAHEVPAPLEREPAFHPPQATGSSAHPPVWRTREESEREAAEAERAAHAEQEARSQRNRERLKQALRERERVRRLREEQEVDAHREAEVPRVDGVALEELASTARPRQRRRSWEQLERERQQRQQQLLLEDQRLDQQRLGDQQEQQVQREQPAQHGQHDQQGQHEREVQHGQDGQQEEEERHEQHEEHNHHQQDQQAGAAVESFECMKEVKALDVSSSASLSGVDDQVEVIENDGEWVPEEFAQEVHMRLLTVQRAVSERVQELNALRGQKTDAEEAADRYQRLISARRGQLCIEAPHGSPDSRSDSSGEWD